MGAGPVHAESQSKRRISIEDGGLLLFERAFAEDSALLFSALRDRIDWRQHQIRIFGRIVPVPRLSAWYGDEGCDYRYSGLQLHAEPIPALLEPMRERIAELCGHRCNAVLLNLYRDGRDSMGWHADDEPELDPDAPIASVSLGAARRFLLRHRQHRDRRVELHLGDGSLLLMEPPLQRHWQHSVPRSRSVEAVRINLTWRTIRR